MHSDDDVFQALPVCTKLIPFVYAVGVAIDAPVKDVPIAEAPVELGQWMSTRKRKQMKAEFEQTEYELKRIRALRREFDHRMQDCDASSDLGDDGLDEWDDEWDEVTPDGF